MSDPVDRIVQRWQINGKFVEKRGVSNCAAYMNDPMRATFPQRWEEVPKGIYDPIERLKVLATDGVDGEVVFPNPPVQNASFSSPMPSLSSPACKHITMRCTRNGTK